MRPLPCGLDGRHTTSISSTSALLYFHSSCSACSDSQLSVSVPQKRMRSGSVILPLVVLYKVGM